MDFIRTNKGKEILALWAKACVTVLPCLTIWEKDELRKEFTRIWASFTKWPILDECSKSQPLSALITFLESPSNWNYWRPSSKAKMTARRAANISKLSTLCGLSIFSAITATTCPIESLTTIPIPASSL